MRKNVLDINAIKSAKSAAGIFRGAAGVVGGLVGTSVDTLTSCVGRSVALWLISATAADGNYLLFEQNLCFSSLKKHINYF